VILPVDPVIESSCVIVVDPGLFEEGIGLLFQEASLVILKCGLRIHLVGQTRHLASKIISMAYCGMTVGPCCLDIATGVTGHFIDPFFSFGFDRISYPSESIIKRFRKFIYPSHYFPTHSILLNVAA
jgi:hypothetical protein